MNDQQKRKDLLVLLCVDFIPDDTGKSQMLLENFKRKKKQLNIHIT